jgi:hypothetical protein
VDNHPGKGVNFIITLPAQEGIEKKSWKCERELIDPLVHNYNCS